MTNGLIIFAGVLAIGFAFYLRRQIARLPDGTPKMREIALAIREGSFAFLKRQYTTVAYVAVVLFLILGVSLGWLTAAGVFVGAAFFSFVGFLGMMEAGNPKVG